MTYNRKIEFGFERVEQHIDFVHDEHTFTKHLHDLHKCTHVVLHLRMMLAIRVLHNSEKSATRLQTGKKVRERKSHIFLRAGRQAPL
jgi:hypothetical protein